MNSTPLLESANARGPAAYTAAQLAAALGQSKQSIRRKVNNSPADSARIVAGNAADAWSFAALPVSLQNEIAAEAARLGYRNAEQFLAAPREAWKPARPLNQVAQADLDKAAKLMRALAPSLERLDNPVLSSSDIERLGVADYRREFGFAISARHWRRLFRRTLERDSAAEQFQRLELYLDERPARPPADSKAMLAHAELQTVIAQFKEPNKPTVEESGYFWTRIFEHFEERLAQRKAPGKTRRTLLEFLFARAPFLAESREGLRKQFARKYAAWTTGGRVPSAVTDKRPVQSGRFRKPELSPDDRDVIIGRAVLEKGGNLAAAWRDCQRNDRLSQEVSGYYLSNPARKSYVPKSIVDQVRAEIDSLEDIHHGPRQAKLNGAWISRDWSNVAAGDWYQADDVTFPVYYYEPDGNGWFTLWRGQCLVMIDVRSARILGYALLSSRNYNSLAIRTLITRVCEQHGLPRKGFYFERGVWQTSKLLKGQSDKLALSDIETERGLRDLGLKFVHSNLPRSKPVERVIGLTQDLMEGEPGYVGRDERNDKFERVQKLKLAVESRKLSPEGHFLSAEQWLARLDEIFAAYNAEPQEGKMTAGLSPDDAFAKFQRAGDAQICFDASCRYLLAHHKRPARVTRNGITLRFGKNVFNYRNETTGRLIGQTVLAWFNPEMPEILCVTDLNRENPFSVERSQDVPAMEAAPELLAQEMQRIGAHQSHAKSYYRILRSKFAPRFRPNLVAPETEALGAEMDRQRSVVQEQRRQENARVAKVRRVSKELGVNLAPSVARRPQGVESAQRLAELLNAPEENEP